MKTYRQFIEESKSLSRVTKQMRDRDSIIVSANRGDNTKKQNKAADKKLSNTIRGRTGQGARKLKGAFNEPDHGEQSETSFHVKRKKGQGSRSWNKDKKKYGQVDGFKHKKNRQPGAVNKDQDSVLDIKKSKKGKAPTASWLGTSKRKTSDPKFGKRYDQGKMNTKDAGSSIKPGEGATKVGKKNLQFKK